MRLLVSVDRRPRHADYAQHVLPAGTAANVNAPLQSVIVVGDLERLERVVGAGRAEQDGPVVGRRSVGADENVPDTRTPRTGRIWRSIPLALVAGADRDRGRLARRDAAAG